MLLRLPPNQLLHRISLLPLQQPPRSPLVHLRRLCLRIQQLFRQVFIRHALLRHRLRPQTRRLLRHPPLSSLQQVFPTLFVLISHRTQYYEIDIKSSKSCRIGFIRFFIFFNVTVFFKRILICAHFVFVALMRAKTPTNASRVLHLSLARLPGRSTSPQVRFFCLSPYFHSLFILLYLF